MFIVVEPVYTMTSTAKESLVTEQQEDAFINWCLLSMELKGYLY